MTKKVFQSGHAEGGHAEGALPEDRRHEARHADRGAVRGVPVGTSHKCKRKMENPDSPDEGNDTTVWMRLSGRRSKVWGHFKADRNNKTRVKCDHCPSVFSYTSSTTDFWRHLGSAHHIGKSGDEAASKPPTSKTPLEQPNIRNAFAKLPKDPQDKVYARMAAKHGISFHVLAHREDIKRGLEAQGYKPYNSRTSVSNAIKRYAKEVKCDIKELLKKRKTEDIRFSITTDEWTNNQNAGFGNFNVHMPDRDWVCIGTARIVGSFDAKGAEKKLREKCEDFGLALETDVVGTVTDGVSLMKAMGKNLPTLHVICMAHGLHLAVTDVLYKVCKMI